MTRRLYCLAKIFSHFAAGPIPLRVREAQVPVVNDNECVRKINAVTEKIFILPASSFCAGGEEGHDACQVRKETKNLTSPLLGNSGLFFTTSKPCNWRNWVEITGNFAN